MKILKTVVAVSLAVCTLAAPFAGMAADEKGGKKLKPYVLKTCIISGDKLDEMGKPVVYAYEGREIQFCCKDCIKTFKKDPAKYVKKIEAAEAKLRKKG